MRLSIKPDVRGHGAISDPELSGSGIKTSGIYPIFRTSVGSLSFCNKWVKLVVMKSLPHNLISKLKLRLGWEINVLVRISRRNGDA